MTRATIKAIAVTVAKRIRFSEDEGMDYPYGYATFVADCNDDGFRVGGQTWYPVGMQRRDIWDEVEFLVNES